MLTTVERAGQLVTVGAQLCRHLLVPIRTGHPAGAKAYGDGDQVSGVDSALLGHDGRGEKGSGNGSETHFD